MISLTFAQFFRGEYEDEGYELYMVKDADQIMYIGISRNSVWHRWFGGTTSHMGVLSDERVYGISSIGKAIARRLPASWNWIIELWTRQDCRKALVEEWDDRKLDALPITFIEALLIEKFGPTFNATHGGGAREDPLVKRALDQAYKEIFEKREDTGNSKR